MQPVDQAPLVATQRRADPPGLHKETQALTEIIDRLSSRFPLLPRDTIVAAVTDAHQRFDGTLRRDFVPVLLEREARLRLQAHHHHQPPLHGSTTSPAGR